MESSAENEMTSKISMLVADLGWLEHCYAENEPVTDDELSMWENDFLQDAHKLMGLVTDWRRTKR